MDATYTSRSERSLTDLKKKEKKSIPFTKNLLVHQSFPEGE